MTHTRGDRCFDASPRCPIKNNKIEKCIQTDPEQTESTVESADSNNNNFVQELSSSEGSDGQACGRDDTALAKRDQQSIDDNLMSGQIKDVEASNLNTERCSQLCHFDTFDKNILLACSGSAAHQREEQIEINIEPWVKEKVTETKSNKPVKTKRLPKIKVDPIKRLAVECTKCEHFEFHHYENIREYIKQYRFHHCVGGVFKKFTKLVTEEGDFDERTLEKITTPRSSMATNYDVYSMVNLKDKERQQTQEAADERMRHLNLSPTRNQSNPRCPLTRTPRLQYLSFEEYVYLTLTERHEMLQKSTPTEQPGKHHATNDGEWYIDRSHPAPKPAITIYKSPRISDLSSTKKFMPGTQSPLDKQCKLPHSSLASPRKSKSDSRKGKAESYAVYSLKGRKDNPHDKFQRLNTRLDIALPKKKHMNTGSYMYPIHTRGSVRKRRPHDNSSAQTNCRLFVCDRTNSDLIF